MQPNLKINIGKLELKNPVMVASGTFGYGEEFAELYDISKLGAVVTKGISLKPRAGNPMPRVIETSSGMINAIGLANVGVEAFLREKLTFLRKSQATVIVNIFGESIEEYVALALKLEGMMGISALELNISCPNVAAGGACFGTDIKLAESVTTAVRKVSSFPLIVKLSPQVTDIVSLAKAVVSAGADALSLINTIPAMVIGLTNQRPAVANITGGLSGPAIKPIALRMVWEVARAVNVPIIGVGGIMSASDAIEFFLAGACAIQVGTANFKMPNIALDILSGIRSYLIEHQLNDVRHLIGKLIIENNDK
jgi:dihydroorotate dehydrogenase (NAD+) catalytic subunit